MHQMPERVQLPSFPATDHPCMYCASSNGHWERIYTGDRESLDGWEDWYCCHVCRDSGHACETFHRITEPTPKPRTKSPQIRNKVTEVINQYAYQNEASKI